MYSRIIPVFISSSDDVGKEREIIDRVIKALSPKLLKLFGIMLYSEKWENFRPLSARSEEIQDIINARLEKSALFVGILYSKYGECINPETNISATHEEIRFAIQNDKNLKILIYKREPMLKIDDNNKSDVENRHRFNKLIEEIKKSKILYKKYDNVDYFEQNVTLDLMEAVLEMTTEASRREKLNKFFKFGISRRQREANVLIGYPPIHKHFGPSQRASYDWTQRLVPNVVYEDFRALRKIENSLNCMGVFDHKTVTTHYEDLRERGNRIWLCIPRNEIAQKKLDLFGNRVRFEFIGENSSNRELIWLNDNDDKITVKSPLQKYSRVQVPSATVSMKKGVNCLH